MPVISCCVTGKTAEAKSKAGNESEPCLPMGWKRMGTSDKDCKYYSPEAFSQLYCVRALTIPVDRVVVGYNTPFPDDYENSRYSEDWSTFMQCCYTTWQQITQLSNKILYRLAQMDPGLDSTKDPVKLLPFRLENSQRNAFRAELAQLYPKINSQSLIAVMNHVISQYMSDRFDVLVRGSVSLRNFRCPQPAPLVKATSKLSLQTLVVEKNTYIPLSVAEVEQATAKGKVLEQRQAVIVHSLISDVQFRLRLKSDPVRFGRQLDPIYRVISGELLRGDPTLRLSPDKKQVLFTQPVYMPRMVRDEHGRKPGASECFLVRTDPECFLVGELQGRKIFILNECQLKRWQASSLEETATGEPQATPIATLPDLKQMTATHSDLVQKMGEDRKAERRGRVAYSETNGQETKKKRRRHARNMQRSLEARCEKHRRRMTDALHKISLIVVNHATRRSVDSIVYDDDVRSYMPSFPYYRLAQMIKDKAQARGMTCITRSELREKEKEAEAKQATKRKPAKKKTLTKTK